MNGTLNNYLLHALSGTLIFAIAAGISLLLDYPKPVPVSLMCTLFWWYSHETADEEHRLKGPARRNIHAAMFWRWPSDSVFDFLAGIAPAIIISVVVEITGFYP